MSGLGDKPYQNGLNVHEKREDDATLLLTRNYPTNYNSDAWGKPKTSQDYSLVSGMFTFDVPNSSWILFQNDVESVNEANIIGGCESTNGTLSLHAGSSLNDARILMSKRHPKYQPNRGFTWSGSVFLPNPTDSGERDFGVIKEEDGVFFRLKTDGKLYACILSDTVLQEEQEITIPFVVDLNKGIAYDIQFQWRGVGDYRYFIVNPATGLPALVHEIKYNGTLDYVSVSNPALSLGFKCTNLGDNVELRAGCVDVSTEGGKKAAQKYIATDSNEVTGILATGSVMVAIRMAKTFKGKTNTRDAELARVTATLSKKGTISVYITRDATALSISVGTWVPINGGNIEAFYPVAATDSTFDDAKAQRLARRPMEALGSIEITNPSPDTIDFYLIHGDIIVVEGYATSALGTANIELGEEI